VALPGLARGFPPDLAMACFRDSPQQPLHLILWARSDLFRVESWEQSNRTLKNRLRKYRSISQATR
jgi:hypothetical protein